MVTTAVYYSEIFTEQCLQFQSVPSLSSTEVSHMFKFRTTELIINDKIIILSYPINKQTLCIHADSCQYMKTKTTGTQKNQ